MAINHTLNRDGLLTTLISVCPCSKGYGAVPKGSVVVQGAFFVFIFMKHTLLISILIVVIAALGTISLELKIRQTQIEQQRVRIEQEKWNAEQLERAQEEARLQEAAAKKAAQEKQRQYENSPEVKAANLKTCLAAAATKRDAAWIEACKTYPQKTIEDCKKLVITESILIEMNYSSESYQCNLKYGN